MKICCKTLKRCAFIYLALPLLIFVGGFLRWQAAVPAGIGVLIGVLFAWKSAGQDRGQLEVGRFTLPILAGVVLLWSYVGGMNGLFFQSNDWRWRNAIFHDLIDMEWPVIYEEKGSALVYYIGFWLPAALPAKLAGALGGPVVAWRVARGALWLWTSAGLAVTALMLMAHAGADTPGKRAGVLGVFVFFSGMDVLGMLYVGNREWLTSPEVMHLEWWMPDGKQFSAMTTCLYWVFNQSVVPWMVVMCFLMERDARNYLFLAAACLCCGPLPLVGLTVCMLVRFGEDALREMRTQHTFENVKAAFSLPNLLLLGTVLPILGAYYMGNLSVARTAGMQTSALDSLKSYVTPDFLVFFLLEAGVWLALFWRDHRREALFYGVAASLLIIPFFHVGASEDFCMRASIPGIFILMTYCAQYVCRKRPALRKMGRCARFRWIMVTCVFLIGAATPVMEMYRGIYHVWTEKSVHLAKDDIGSIGTLEEADNFTTENYEEKLFFRYFAKEK